MIAVVERVGERLRVDGEGDEVVLKTMVISWGKVKDENRVFVGFIYPRLDANKALRSSGSGSDIFSFSCYEPVVATWWLLLG